MTRPVANYHSAEWMRRYDRDKFVKDMVAAIIVAIMLIPQSLAYALLAGLPPEVGLYSSILPLIGYALFGTSTSLSVGPVAITSLMTASSVGSVAASGTADYLTASIQLAAMSGILLLLFGVLKLGFLASFLSHTVVSGFITASAIIIALSQTKHILGIEAEGDNIIHLTTSIYNHIDTWSMLTLVIGFSAVLFLYLVRLRAVTLLQMLGISKSAASLIARSAPVAVVILGIAAVSVYGLDSQGVATVGTIPAGVPALGLPNFSLQLARELLIPAVMISIIGYVESISVGRTLGAKRKEAVNSDQELIGLGVANLASSVSGGFPVTGGFSRSVVNFDAGAVTQAASIFTAGFIALATLYLTPALQNLPRAVLAATIIVAVLSLVDFKTVRNTWHFSRSDGLAVTATLVATLLLGVELGVLCGVSLSLGLYINRTLKPHIAEVGLVEGTEHFRNVRRYQVSTVPQILTLRVDESLFFANAAYLEAQIYDQIFDHDHIAHVVVMCAAINEIDYSALEVLEEINRRLDEQGIVLHLSEVKGPILDKLQGTHFLQHLTGKVYLSQFQAWTELSQRYAGH